MLELISDSLASCFGVLQASLSPAVLSWSLTEQLQIGERKVAILKQIGEGGYSFVYQVRDTHTNEELALKKIFISGEDQLSMVKREILVMQSLHHPNLLPLLCSAYQSLDGVTDNVAFMLCPLYKVLSKTQEGSLFEVVSKCARKNESLPPKEILNIFLQVCRAVLAMHISQPALAHRDIKPHNVLLQHSHEVAGSMQEERNTEDLEISPKEVLNAARAIYKHCPESADGRERFRAVLMDFGSAQEIPVVISNRLEAMKMQEDAEAQCSAPYRAPELFDVPSHCTIDQRIDIWSLGCLLFFMICAVSPFERVHGEAGGSLALAVANGAVRWPEMPGLPCPIYRDLKELVEFCLEPEPARRPFLTEVFLRAESMYKKIT